MNTLLNPTIAQIAHEHLLWLLLFPALALGLLLLVEPYIEAAFSRVLTALAATAGLVTSLWLANDLSYLVVEKRRFGQELGVWLGAPGVNINLDLIYDPLSAVVAAALCAVFALTAWQPTTSTQTRQGAMQTLLLLSCLLTFLARDLLLFLSAWALSGWLAQRLISDSLAERRGFGQTLAYASLVLDLLLVVAAVILANVGGGSGDLLSIRFNLANLAPQLPPAATHWPAQLFMAAAVTRAAMLPAGLWRQRAFGASVLANLTPAFAALTLPAVYLFIRLSPLFAAEPVLLATLAGLGAWTALYFAGAALLETSLTRALLNLLLSQFGLIAVALGTGVFAAALAGAIALLLAAILLVTAAAIVREALAQAGDDADTLETMGGLGARLPAAFFMFTFGVAALVGFPPFSSFLSQHALLWQSTASALRQANVAAIAPLAALILAAAAVRLWLSVFYGPFRGRPETRAQLQAPSWGRYWPAWLAAALALTLGWWTSPTFALVASDAGLFNWIRPVLRATIVQIAPTMPLLGMVVGSGLYAILLTAALVIASVVTWWADFSGLGARLANLGPVRLLATLLQRQFYLPQIANALLVRLPFGILLIAVALLQALSENGARLLALPAAWLLPKTSDSSVAKDNR